MTTRRWIETAKAQLRATEQSIEKVAKEIQNSPESGRSFLWARRKDLEREAQKTRELIAALESYPGMKG